MLDDFFAHSEIAHVFSLVDIRHDPTEDDRLMINYLYGTRMPFTILATKADKLAKTRVKDAVRRIAAALRTGEKNVIALSNATRRGKEEILTELDAILARSQQTEPDAEDE